MLRFFSKMRYKLAVENRVAKYLRYAVGEILLVVIGILIALQVNNWNDRRKELIDIELSMNKIENELSLNILSANHDIRNSTKLDPVFKRVLSNKVNIEDYRKYPIFILLPTWRFTLNPVLDNQNKLIEKEEVLPEKYNKIIDNVHRLDFINGREQDAMKRLKESAEENEDYLNLNYSWRGKSDSLSLEEAYHYYLTNEDYKQRLFSHWTKAMFYTDIITMYRSRNFTLLAELKILRQNFGAEDLKIMLEDFDQAPFKIFKPETLTDSIAPINLSQYPLLINTTGDTLNVNVYSRNENLVNEMIVLPQSIGIDNSGNFGDLDTDYLRIFEVYRNDSLLNKYYSVPNGFLLLE